MASTISDLEKCWHPDSLTAYACPGKTAEHVLLRVSSFPSSTTKLPTKHRRPPMTPAPAEFVGSSAIAATDAIGLWIGVYIPKDDSTEKTNDSKEERTKIHGKSVNSLIAGHSYTTIPETNTALRVVVNVQAHSQVQYFALVNPDKHGICEAYIVKSDNIWWFRQFRDDDLTTKEGRRQIGSTRVRKYLAEHVKNIADSNWRPSIYKSTMLDSETRSTALMVTKSYNCHLQDPASDTLHLEEMLKELEKLYTTLRAEKTGPSLVWRLIDVREPFESKEADELSKQLESLFPGSFDEVAVLTSDELRYLARGLRADGAPLLDIDLVRIVILDWKRICQGARFQEKVDDDFLRHSVQESIQWCRLYQPKTMNHSPQAMVERTLSSNETISFMKSNINFLEGIQRQGQETTAAILRASGTPTSSETLDDIMKKLVQSTDRDEMIVWANDVVGYVARMILAHYSKDEQQLEQHITRLRHTLKELEELEDLEDDDGSDGNAMDESE